MFYMQLEVGAIIEGKVTGITKFGAFVDLGDGKTGMIHISEVAGSYVNEIRDHLTENQIVKVKVISIDKDNKISLSIKKLQEQKPRQAKNTEQKGSARPDTIEQNSPSQNLSFEDMLNKFKQQSDEKISDLKKNVDSKRGSGYSKGRGKY